MLKDENQRKNSLTSLEPRQERSSPCCIVSEYRFNEMWFLTVDPFVGISVFIAKLSKRQYCRRVIEDFESQEYAQFFNIHRCLFMRLHFSIGGYTIVRLHAFVKVSISASLKSFLLIICIDLMQTSTYFPKVRRMLIFHAPWIFNTFWASCHAASRAPCSCHSVSSWDRPSNFGALGLRSWGSPGQINPSEGFFVSNFSATCNGLREFRTVDWLRHVCAP